MHLISRQVGTTSCIVEIFIGDSTVTTGAGKTGLAYNTSSLIGYYKRNTAAAAVAITLATVATQGTFASGGFVEVDATHMPGVYELHIPNAALIAGADSVVIELSGATGMRQTYLLIELTANSNQDAIAGGITALPAVVAGATGGLPTVDSANSVKVQSPVKKNVALANFGFVMLSQAGNPLAGLGTGITAKRSIDGGAFAGCTNTPAEVAYGSYKISLSAADLNGSTIVLRFSAANARDTFILLVTNA